MTAATAPTPWAVPPGRPGMIFDAQGNFVGLCARSDDAQHIVAKVNAVAATTSPEASDELRQKEHRAWLETTLRATACEKSLRALLQIFDMIGTPEFDNPDLTEARTVIAEIDRGRAAEAQGGAFIKVEAGQ